MASRVVSFGMTFLGVLMLVACTDEVGSDDDHGSGGSSGAGSEPRVCYFESRVSYSCSDGDGNPGEWEATCSELPEDDCYNHPDFDGSSDFVDGCTFRTEFRSNEMMSTSECNDRSGGSGEPAGTGASTSTGGGNGPSAATGGGAGGGSPPSPSTVTTGGPSCTETGYQCTAHDQCCSNQAGHGYCVAYSTIPGAAYCADTCSSGSNCVSGCCAATELGGVCAPAEECGGGG